MNPKCKIDHSHAMHAINKLAGTAMPKQQRGLVLVFSLIFLLLMTLIGITSMRTSTLEEKMSGNTRDKQLAFMAAETALREAETAVEAYAAIPATGNGFYDDSSDADYTLSGTWAGTNSIVSSAIPDVNTAPRYFIKHVTCISDSGNTSPTTGKGYSYGKTAGDTQMFRITARGTGGTDTTSAVVRSHYGKVLGSC